jgi:signal transduction histidine kinase
MGLLALTLGLAGLLALEAEDEAGSHREAGARVLRAHLAATGRDAVDAVAGALGAALADALGPAVAARAASPYEVLAAPAVLAGRPAANGGLACASPAPSWVRVDLRDGTFAAAGAPLPPAVARWARAAALGAVRASLPRPLPGGGDAPYAVVFGAGPAAGRALALGVRRAPFEAPIAAYGLVTCADAFGPRLVVAARRRAGAGAALDLALADALVAVAVAPRGAAPAGVPGGAPGAVLAERSVAGLTVQARAGAGAARRVVVAAPRRGRLLLLGLLAAATGGLAVVALRQLRRAQELVRLRADFTSSVSHELRTPLAQIRLYGETLALGRVRGEPERRDAAEAVVREARRLERLVENVLHVARAERRLNRPRLEAVALAPLAEAVAREFAPLVPGACVRAAVGAAPGGGLLAARADPAALRQVLLNLLDNAARYGPPGQTVTVGAAAAPGGVEVWVDDDGPGIPPGARARVWEAFVRLPARGPVGGGAAGGAGTVAATASPGSGLGLAVVADLARLQGGEPWVRDAPGGGARVGLTLPGARLAPA